MHKGRLEAFSDGVIAIIITIMVLEMRSPHGADFASLKPIIPVFLSYVMSFIYVGIYWNNHHHLLHTAKHVDGRILWANMHLLFWLSLVPFVTAWMGENHFASAPVMLYGVVLICAAVAYTILTRALLARHGKDSLLASAIGSDFKGNISIAIYAAAIGMAFKCPGVSCALYALVALMWLVPDTRIEKVIAQVEP